MVQAVENLFKDHRFAIMGIVNVTPDSFSDGGQFFLTEKAVSHGIEIYDHGVDLIDIGGESTRPGSEGISIEQELERVVPVIEGIKNARPDALISIDTSKVKVAQQALQAGAWCINDVTAGQSGMYENRESSEKMFELAASKEAPIILMHMRGEPRTMQTNTQYEDIVEEIRAYLIDRAAIAEATGVLKENIIIDPGIGFGKSLKGNLTILRNLARLEETGYPLLIGTSRKSFLGLITGAPVEERLGATLASFVPILSLERAILRVHDVLEVLRYRAVLEALDLGRFLKL